jgi:hypothetical protein
MTGIVDVIGDQDYYYYLYGNANIEGTSVSFTDYNPVGSPNYNLDVPFGTWSVRPAIYFPATLTSPFAHLRLSPDIFDVPERDTVIHDWIINPGYVTGNIEFTGSHGNMNAAYVYGMSKTTSSNYGYSYTADGAYRLILNEGEWAIGYPLTRMYFNYDDIVGTSELQVYNYSLYFVDEPQTVTSGNTIDNVNLLFDTATVTVNFIVDGGGELKLPKLFATLSEGIYPDLTVSYASSTGSSDLTQLGESTITVLAGSHIVGAYATVEGSYTKFGEFPITVEPGDQINLDVGAPSITVTAPAGLQHTCDSFIEVVGTATDDNSISTVKVNGVEVEFEPTNNPEDDNEVSFSAIVQGLEFGENVISIEVIDEYDKSSVIERTIIRDVCNLPPTITSITGPSDPVSILDSYSMIGTFTDPNGVDDTHTAIWDWGDGTTSEGTVDQDNDVVSGYHQYAEPGVYTVTLTVTDEAGESDTQTWTQYLVIYDPEGGFVTGGGWIDSPPGSYTADPDLGGKANFGFVAKYKKGATEPTGNTEFQFKAGDLNFHSSQYDWLVIAGARAVYKGTGTINGEGSYNFMLTAIDGDVNGGGGVDKFRIKIWVVDEITGEDVIIYDNMLGAEDDADLGSTTELGGGSIKLHKG